GAPGRTAATTTSPPLPGPPPRTTGHDGTSETSAADTSRPGRSADPRSDRRTGGRARRTPGRRAAGPPRPAPPTSPDTPPAAVLPTGSGSGLRLPARWPRLLVCAGRRGHRFNIRARTRAPSPDITAGQGLLRR